MMYTQMVFPRYWVVLQVRSPVSHLRLRSYYSISIEAHISSSEKQTSYQVLHYPEHDSVSRHGIPNVTVSRTWYVARTKITCTNIKSRTGSRFVVQKQKQTIQTKCAGVSVHHVLYALLCTTPGIYRQMHCRYLLSKTQRTARPGYPLTGHMC